MATSHALKHTLTPSLWALIPVARTHNPSGPARFQTPYRCCWQTSRRCPDCQSHRSTLCHFLSSGQALSLPWPYRYTQKNKHKPSLLTLFFCCYKKKYLRNKEKTVVLVKVNMIHNVLAEAKTLATSKQDEIHTGLSRSKSTFGTLSFCLSVIKSHDGRNLKRGVDIVRFLD